MLQRYVGLAVIATGLVAIFFIDKQSWHQRMVCSALMTLAILPTALWLFVTSGSIGWRPPENLTDNF